MPYNPNKHHRRSIRLPGYDYALSGAYFVTICVRDGECLLGDVVNEEMRLNGLGQIAHDFWAQVPAHFPGVSIDAFVIMPNHVHAIVVIQESPKVVGDGGKGEGTSPLQDVRYGENPCRGAVTAPVRTADPITQRSKIENPTLGQIVAYYKYQTTKQINELQDMPGVAFWQRNYWEHIIRNEASLDRIREYIENNPARWAEDQLHPEALPNRFNRWPSG